MALLNDRDRKKVQAELAKLEHPVTLIGFTQELACQYCRENDQLLAEVAGLSDLITYESCNFTLEKEKVERYGIDKIPAIVVAGEKDYKVRFYGVPFGYEFISLIEAMKDVSHGATSLKPETRAKLAGLTAPVRIQVFVTPT